MRYMTIFCFFYTYEECTTATARASSTGGHCMRYMTNLLFLCTFEYCTTATARALGKGEHGDMCNAVKLVCTCVCTCVYM
jgi:hypothetical protein